MELCELTSHGMRNCSLTNVLFKDVLFRLQPNNYLAFIDHAMITEYFINIWLNRSLKQPHLQIK